MYGAPQLMKAFLDAAAGGHVEVLKVLVFWKQKELNPRGCLQWWFCLAILKNPLALLWLTMIRLLGFIYVYMFFFSKVDPGIAVVSESAGTVGVKRGTSP